MTRPMNRYLVMMLHDLTQRGYWVMFERDFEGMLTLVFGRDGEHESIHHDHVGMPHDAPEKLDEKVIKCLEDFAA